jgi:hypothetical protein
MFKVWDTSTIYMMLNGPGFERNFGVIYELVGLLLYIAAGLKNPMGLRAWVR